MTRPPSPPPNPEQGDPPDRGADPAQAAEQRYRDLVDGLDAIVWEADAETGHFTFVSRRAEQLLGYPVARWLEDPDFWLTLIHPDDRLAAVEACQTARLAGRPHDCEYRVTAAGGREVWLRDAGYPVGDGGRGRRGTMTDVTERRRLEDELRRRADALAEAGRHKDEFLALLAHELRNPLAPVRNALHVLRARGDDRTTREWAQDVLDRQVGHLARLVDDLLDVSRLTRGKIVLKRERVDLAWLIRAGVEDHHRAALDAAGLTLELDLPPTAVWVEGDSTRLAQILDNLLSNAGKFTPPGGRVTVRLRGGADARVTVRDTGVGIAPDLVPHLFQTLTQADSTLERSQGGLGLGLALVKGLVEMHGGRVDARSGGLGQGAEFVVTLPLERGGTPERGAAPASGPPPGRPLRILMVEDNRDGAETLQALLQLAGHEVALACTGPDGVSLAHQFHPDVVLCDLGLPGMDGFAVGRALRQDPVTARSRLIVLSGYGQEEDRRKSREAGFDLHLTKPVDPLELQRLLRAQPMGAGGGRP